MFGNKKEKSCQTNICHSVEAEGQGFLMTDCGELHIVKDKIPYFSPYKLHLFA